MFGQLVLQFLDEESLFSKLLLQTQDNRDQGLFIQFNQLVMGELSLLPSSLLRYCMIVRFGFIFYQISHQPSG